MTCYLASKPLGVGNGTKRLLEQWRETYVNADYNIYDDDMYEGNNVVPLRSDTIQLVQNRCSFHELRSEDPNQHLKDFLKLVDSLDHDGRIHHHEEDLTTQFLVQFDFHREGTKTPQRYPDVPTTSWRICPSPQPQALETIFEARIRDYMAAHTERMERFENAIFKQREGINSRTHN
ncbi:hypothetical protein Tco_0291594 [Tanacetum coccineum]